ncbi:hypothetical protein PspCFBP13528_02700 [Pseudomonas sp. CFBP13528]|nr:hypothetical protein PspCFBP13528_02700 [Pseudomonas sp. CFBP13528]
MIGDRVSQPYRVNSAPVKNSPGSQPKVVFVMAAVRGRPSGLPGLNSSVCEPAYSCHPICFAANGGYSSFELRICHEQPTSAPPFLSLH